MNVNDDLDPLEIDECLHALAPVRAHNCIQLPPYPGNRPVGSSQRWDAYAPQSLTTSTTSHMHRPTGAATARTKGTAHPTLPLTRASPAGLAPSRLEDTAMPF